jgi:hypothetical protein
MSVEAPVPGDDNRQEVGRVLGRREVRTHRQLMRDELGEGFDHLWQAAGHAANGVGATVGPRWDSARERLPWVVRMREEEAARQGRRTRILIGLLTAGAAAGAVGALLARRRTRSRWEEYEPRDVGGPERGLKPAVAPEEAVQHQ